MNFIKAGKGAYTGEDIVHPEIIMYGIVNIVAGHGFYIQALGQLRQAAVKIPVAWQPAMGQFNIKVIPAQHGLVLAGPLPALGELSLQD
jgi:hypothetical protein